MRRRSSTARSSKPHAFWLQTPSQKSYPDIVALLFAFVISVVLLVTLSTFVLIITSPSTTGGDPEYTEALGALTVMATTLAAGLGWWLRNYDRTDEHDDDGPDS